MNTRHDHPGQTRWTDDLAEKGAGLIISAFPQAKLNPYLARIAARCVMDLVDSGDHDMDGGVTAAAIEKETRECPDPDAHWRIVEAFERAEKAENRLLNQTIDLSGAIFDRDKARRERDAAFNNALQPRPLTADDISDEMVERGWASISPTLRETLSRHTIRRILETALTEPTRPHGAEQLETLIREANRKASGLAPNLADFLAERGVRVVGEERS